MNRNRLHPLILAALLAGFLLPERVNGQTVLTLQNCLEYAQANHESIRKAALEKQMARLQVQEVRSVGLPQVSAKADVAYNIKLKPMFLPTTGDGGGGAFPFGGAPLEVRESAVIMENFFQLPSAGEVGITLNQLLYDGSYLVGLKAASTYRELAARSEEKTISDVKAQVTKAYYMVQINEARKGLLTQNMNRLNEILTQTQALNENGFAEKLDVQRLEVARNNLAIEQQKFQNIVQLSYLLLKFQMGMKADENIRIADTLSAAAVPALLEGAGSQEAVTYSDRKEYQMLGVQRTLYGLDLRKEKTKYGPSLVGFVNGGYFNQDKKMADVFTNTWYGYSMVGVSLNVPIFNGLATPIRVQRAKLKLQQLDYDVQSLEKAIDLQVKQSSLMLQNNLQTLEAQRKNVELAEEVARITKIKYTEGVGSSLEVTAAETALKEAQVNYYNALYDAVISKIEYDQATGKFN